ncbi:MAG: prepilin-type N-terminal cleavage/methylation domain-containing protein, partial [Candidatus Riflebacteria bacterium]|nr:prepilin-type N-terminal cleavage/methylation domain-containing protein [Candidatus Riflebacteria bacterium]
MQQKIINIRRRRGFTLIEVLVSVVLLSSLILVVSSMYSFIRRTFVRVDGKSASSSEIERFLLRLDGELRSATDVTVPPLDAIS